MASFPSALASFVGFIASHTLSQDSHAAQHNLEQAEILAAQTKIGTGSSTPVNQRLLRGNGTGTSAWAQADLTTDITGVLPQANGGTGTTLATGTGKPVYDTSPTISTPTLSAPLISDFTSANHDHSSASKGGNLGAVTATSLTTNALAANGANHITLSAGTNKLVKTTVLRQDDTTDGYQAGNSVKLTGWGVAVPGATNALNEVVNFGVTFLQRPVVIITSGGDNISGTLTYGAGAVQRKNSFGMAHTITTTGFTARVVTGDAGNWTAGDSVFYQWIAIGEI